MTFELLKSNTKREDECHLQQFNVMVPPPLLLILEERSPLSIKVNSNVVDIDVQTTYLLENDFDTFNFTQSN